MSGPNQPPMNFFGGGAPGGPPKGPPKRFDDRMPTGREVPMRNPGQVQDEAARKFGVRPEQVQASSTPRPQAPPRQAPPMPKPAPERPIPPQVTPPPPTLPQPSARVPLPQPRPQGLEEGNMLAKLDDGGGGPPPGMMAKVIGDRMQQPGGFSSAQAAPAPSNPFEGGAPPMQAGPEMLAKVMAAAKIAAQQKAPPDTPQMPPSPTVTPPVPPGMPPQPPPAYTPSQGTFKGYEIRQKPEKGEEKHSQKVLRKEDNPYYYTRIGVRPGDKRGVAEKLREVREKANNPKTARTMTPEEDRILAQYNEKDAYLLSMLPEDVAKRMQQYKTGSLVGQIPDRYQERPPGVTEEMMSGPTPLKLPNKAVQKRDAATAKAEDAIQNPPSKNDVDPELPPFRIREE